MADSPPGGARSPPRELLLLRHGHAVPHGSVVPDFDRPLDERGRTDTAWMARWAVDAGVVPDLVVSSPARRARETAEGFCRDAGLSIAAIRWRESIYDAHLSGLLRVLAEASAEFRRVMLVGHNPGFEQLAGLLAHGDPYRVRLATAAAARLRMPEDWGGLSPDDAAMIEVVRPPKR